MKTQIFSITKKALGAGAVYCLCELSYQLGKETMLVVFAKRYPEVAEMVNNASFSDGLHGYKKFMARIMENLTKYELKNGEKEES